MRRRDELTRVMVTRINYPEFPRCTRSKRVAGEKKLLMVRWPCSSSGATESSNLLLRGSVGSITPRVSSQWMRITAVCSIINGLDGRLQKSKQRYCLYVHETACYLRASNRLIQTWQTPAGRSVLTNRAQTPLAIAFCQTICQFFLRIR